MATTSAEALQAWRAARARVRQLEQELRDAEYDEVLAERTYGDELANEREALTPQPKK